MPCIDPAAPDAAVTVTRRGALRRGAGWLLAGALPVGGLLGCAQAPRPGTSPAAPPPAPVAPPAAAPAPPSPGPNANSAIGVSTAPKSPATPSAQAAGQQANRGPRPRQPRHVALPAPATPRTAAALQVQFALRLVQAHPDGTYEGPPPERLYAIPVLEVDLHADGSVRAIKVLRRPSTGDEATRLAMDAVRRAAPYGNVSRLPKPWRVVETFLFDDDLRFKPRTLDVD